MALTIAQIAGIINLGAVLSNWSVTSRVLNNSWWPTILSSDTAAVSKVSTRVAFLSISATTALLLLGVAAVITPLGLYDTVTASSVKATDFVFAQDISPIGQATLSRDSYNTSRICGFLMWQNCPGQGHGFWMINNQTGNYLSWESDAAYISSVVPDNLTDLFSSGRQDYHNRATVATPFDIGFRSYTLESEKPRQLSVLTNISDALPDPMVDHNQKRAQGVMQYGDMLLLADKFVIRDGIVADMRNGGLGFRNHTIPEYAHYGAEWTEGLLWLEPETVCIENNITIEFRLPSYTLENQIPYLVDHGGLTTIPASYPFIDLNNTQQNPTLYGRARKGAILTNWNLRQQLKVSAGNASYHGKRFRMESDLGTSLNPGVMTIGDFDIGIPGLSMSRYSNARENLTLIDQIELVTTGYGGGDIANFSHIANAAGLVLGAFTNIDNTNDNRRDDPGSNYSAPLFSCSTSIRAFIMDVTFFINGTSTLEDLQVRSAVPREYGSNATTPLWAQENTFNMNISDVQPLWGIVDDKYEFDQRLWTIRRDFMYLPAGSAALRSVALVNSDSFGSSGPLQTLSMLYRDLPTNPQMPDYLGTLSLPLRQKWQQLSRSKEGIANIMALRWTDMTANYVTSSRSHLNSHLNSVTTYTQRALQNIPTTRTVNVMSYDHVIRYHMPYAALAIIFCTFYTGILITALAMCITGKSTVHLIRTLLNQTSVGRAVTIERSGTDESTSSQMRGLSTSHWIQKHGDEDIGVVKERKSQRHGNLPRHGTAQKYEPIQSSPNLELDFVPKEPVSTQSRA